MVALTGWGQNQDQRRSQAAGFDRHLVKPIEPAVLMKLLDSPPSGSGSDPS
jgi:CheY-like chemotaxis protein